MEKMQELAVSQFIGYRLAQQGYSIIMLVKEMGLTKNEWLKIKKDIPTLRDGEVEEIDEYFTKNS